MTATRLTALDASFLEAETPTAHMHVGWAALFDPPDHGPRPTFDDLLAHIAGRMARAPRYRQRLAEVPLGAADPLWVDDTGFRIERHVRRSRRDDLSGLIDDVMSRRLRRDRPLWELWIADELADGRLGIVGKAHHCMVDGLAAVELATLLLDPEPEPAAPPRDAWRPAPPPGPLGLLAGGIASRAQGAMNVATAVPLHLARNPGEITRAPELAAKAGRALVDSVRPGAGMSRFTGDGSPLRHLATASRPLDDLRTIARATGTSVNDVLLAATAGGVRQFELERGGEPRPLKTMVPVSVRASDGQDELGNRIAFMFIDIPCDEPAPRRRLERVAAEMGSRKQNGHPEGADFLLRLLGLTPRTVQHVLNRLVSSPRTFDIVVSNIPGPRPPLWMLGCALREAYPVVPMADSHAVSIGMTTVRDDAFLGVYADREALPDGDRLAELIDGAFDQLGALVAEPVLA